eukprot:5443937-Amphidinium_carterae.1
MMWTLPSATNSSDHQICRPFMPPRHSELFFYGFANDTIALDMLWPSAVPFTHSQRVCVCVCVPKTSQLNELHRGVVWCIAPGVRSLSVFTLPQNTYTDLIQKFRRR